MIMNKNNQPQNAAQYRNTAVQQNAQPKPSAKPRKRIRIKPNKEGMAQLLVLLLVVVVAVALVVLIAKGVIFVVDNFPAETTTSSDNQNQTENPWNHNYGAYAEPNSNISAGDLILVNFNNAYPHADSLNSKNLKALVDQEGYSSYFVLGTRDVKVRSTIANALTSMISALVEANPDTLGTKSDGSRDRVIITSGYRDTAKQTELFEKNQPGYSAAPGHSEHHTGYAVDIQIFTSKEATVLLRSAEQEWMEEHCAEYGFIIRYDGSKYETTGILDEPWHYRYVGVPHATYMSEHNLCLEEYLELIRTRHTYEKSPLEIKAGEKNYLVYYVAATENDTFTSIPVPPASEGTYSISGDNMNGFIVTVEKAS